MTPNDTELAALFYSGSFLLSCMGIMFLCEAYRMVKLSLLERLIAIAPQLATALKDNVKIEAKASE